MKLIQELRNAKIRIFQSEIYPIKKINGKNIIFIHINKNGGTSINSILKEKKIHLTVKEIIGIIGKERYEKCYKFTVVRNPFDRCVSQYYHRVKTNQCMMRDNPIGFKGWVKKVYGSDKDPYYHDKQYKMFFTQVKWLHNHNDEIDMDMILRFENLNSDFEKMATKIGLNKKIPHLNISKRAKSSYRDYYDNITREIIEKHFQEDLEYFEYKF